MIIHKPSLGSLDVPAVLTFIGYKQTDRQTNKQTDRQAKFIYRLPDCGLDHIMVKPHNKSIGMVSLKQWI